MPTFDAKLVGADELKRKLAELDRNVARKIGSQALRAGAKVVLAKTQELAPVKTGLLKRSLKVRAAKRKKSRIAFMVQTADGNYRGETFYGAFLEFGHKSGKRRRAKGFGNSRRLIAPKPYLGPAFEQTKDAALAVITSTLEAGILAAAK